MQLAFETLKPSVGAVYTPDALVRFVIDAGKDSRGRLPSGRWLDPSCGDGAFLRELVRELNEEGEQDLAEAVESRIFGLDIDEAACDAARAAVRAAVEARVGDLPDDYFAANVVCADGLASWPYEGPFGFIVGNPPYVGATALTAEQKSRFQRDFHTAWGRLDLYALFVERSLNGLGEGGRLTMITPDKLLTAMSCGPLRAHVAMNFAVQSIARFDQHDLFPGVATVPCVTTIARCAAQQPASSVWWRREGTTFTPVGPPSQVLISQSGSPWLPQRSSTRREVCVGDIVERVSVGVATGLNACFVLGSTQAASLGLEPELLRPVVRGRDVRPSRLDESDRVMVLPYVFDGDGHGELVRLQDYPNVARYLERFRSSLEARHCVRVWGKRWYDLHDPVVDDLATIDKVVCPDLARSARFAHDVGRLLPLHSAYFLVPAPDSGWSSEALATALCQPEVEQQILDRAPTAKSGYRRVQADVLRSIHLPVTAVDRIRVAA